MASALPATDPKADEVPRVLIVDDEPSLREVIQDAIERESSCEVLSAGTLSEGRAILLNQSIQLLIADVNLPDGDGTSLLQVLRDQQPTSSAIVITGSPSVAAAISAMREGALDFVPKPFTHKQIVDRLHIALDRQARADKQERRFSRLKTAVKKLNESRRNISRKVDLLCNDLVTAYGDLSRQLDEVRIQEDFRKSIAGAEDLEQLLCHAMDWLLRQLGYCNVAVYLAGDDGDFQLGAYMKYTLAGDAQLTEAMKRVVLPPLARDGHLHVNVNKYEKHFRPQEFQLLKGQDLLGANCTYLGESLASLLFFRDGKNGFATEDEALVRSISAIFAVALASAVRDPHVEEDEGSAPGDGNIDESPRPRRDPADWWKQGGQSPF